MTLSLRYGARSDVGLLRELNEDSMYAGPRLLAIADGMGGHAAGEVASRVAIESVAPLDDDQPGADLVTSLREAVETASRFLQDMSDADTALDGMGTTLTALLFSDRRLGLVHIGDSRGYLLRDGVLNQITHDHTLVQHLVDEGRITPEEASTHPQRSWITRSLTGRGELELDLSIREVREGDRYLLCSDGLSGPVSAETIADTLRSASDPQQACDQLIELALRAGGPDNITAIVADVIGTDSASETPIVGGAAAGAIGTDSAAADSPASRAAQLSRRGRRGGRHSADADDPAAETPTPPMPAKSRAGRRIAIAIGLVAVVVIAVVVGAFFYIRTQYYVGIAKGNPATVGIYRGVSGQVVISLSSLDRRTDLPLQALPPYQQEQVKNGIDASSRADAERIVSGLRSDACPTPSPTPTATATPSPTPKPAASSARAKKTPPPSPTPTPTPTPTPSYCASTP
ncbi:MAG: family protein phosphatase [Frankiaceae bacterium]|nr:family protein phosphatase [Frankiaceae bacterium]